MSHQPGRTSLFALMATTLIVASACSAAVPSGPTGSPISNTPGTGGSGSPSSIFDTPNPIDVAVTLDTDHTVEALVPVEGGTITATGADGSVYTLVIPADALANETTIGLTPVVTVTGLPFGGDRTHAVQLSPDGMSLMNYAILTITPPVAIPASEQVFFSYLHQGKDVIFASPVLASSELKINVLHFSGAGVTNGTQASIDPLRERLGGDVERRLISEVGRRIGIERQRQLLGENPDAIDPASRKFAEEASKEFEERVIKPRLAAAGESCAAGKLAETTVIGYERQRQLLGISDGSDWLANYPGLYNQVARVCMLEEFTACVEHHRIYLILPLYHGLLRQQEFFRFYTPGTLEEARDLTIKCLTFRLEMESTGNINYEGMAIAASDVTLKLTIRYDDELGLISGYGPYLNTDYQIVPPPKCTALPTPGGGTFVVGGLLYEVDAGKPAADGSYPDVRVTDMTLAYTPDNSSEKATLRCPDGLGMTNIPFDVPTWSTAFYDAHADDLDEVGLRATDWEMHGGELFAEKEWDLIGAADPLASEKGWFKLYHVPGG